MAEKTIHCRLITPEAQLTDDEITYASIPAWDGLFGVLPGRAPLVAKLGMGALRLDFARQSGGEGGTRAFLVEDGFVQIVNDKLTSLTKRAIPAESINETDAQAEFAEAEARRVPSNAEDRQARLETLYRDRDRARLKIRIARHNRSKRGAI
jgi:F-type H+-transporting ATPase subunit epsilon